MLPLTVDVGRHIALSEVLSFDQAYGGRPGQDSLENASHPYVNNWRDKFSSPSELCISFTRDNAVAVAAEAEDEALSAGVLEPMILRDTTKEPRSGIERLNGARIMSYTTITWTPISA